MARAGAGHVGQAFSFSRLGLLILLGGKAAAAPVRVEVKIHVGRPTWLRCPPTTDHPGIGPDRFAALPEVGTNHDGILETFAAVHRDHGDRGLCCIAAT